MNQASQLRVRRSGLSTILWNAARPTPTMTIRLNISMMGRNPVYTQPSKLSKLAASWKPSRRKLNVRTWSTMKPQKIIVWRRPAYQ